MRTIFYTTVRVEITHDEPFDNKEAALLAYADINFDFSQEKPNAVMEWVDDELADYNVKE